MLKISHHAILRYAQRFMHMTELQSECLTQPQYDMIRNLLFQHFGHIKTESRVVLNYSPWDCRVVVVSNVLVTITQP